MLEEDLSIFDNQDMSSILIYLSVCIRDQLSIINFIDHMIFSIAILFVDYSDLDKLCRNK